MSTKAPELSEIARRIVTAPRGILAADESTSTIKKRFDAIGIESTIESRRAYRELLFTARDAAPFIGGVILFDETIRQSATDGTPFPQLLEAQGIVPGIKVDAGAHALALAPGETVTEGLDGLRARLAEYHALGARFTKWRAVITIGAGRPSAAGLRANAHALARYAALSQEAGLVPIVEPEVLMDGDHPLERCFEVTAAAHHAVFEELVAQRVSFEGMLLKPNMVVPGEDARGQASVEVVAQSTVRLLRRTVPPAVAGIAFLSGGQSEQQATAHLNAMNQLGPHPWPLTFSYGRALQASTLEAWRGKAEQRDAAQRVYAHRARCNGMATLGQYNESLERELTPA